MDMACEILQTLLQTFCGSSKKKFHLSYFPEKYTALRALDLRSSPTCVININLNKQVIRHHGLSVSNPHVNGSGVSRLVNNL